MKAIEFEGQNFDWMPPRDAKRGECGQLPVFRHDGKSISVWKLDEEDLRVLNEGGHVLLHIWSVGHPPVALTVQKMKELP